jgi:hypothetical protein
LLLVVAHFFPLACVESGSSQVTAHWEVTTDAINVSPIDLG